MSILIEDEYEYDFGFDRDALIKQVIEEAIEFIDCPYESEVNVTLVDNDTIQEINKEHRNINKATDVLSFPMTQFKTPGDFKQLEELDCFNPDTGELMLGDIVISVDKVIEQAKAYNHTQKRELAFLIAHSMLHLFGFDHMEENERIEMEKQQDTILKNVGITRD